MKTLAKLVIVTTLAFVGNTGCGDGDSEKKDTSVVVISHDASALAPDAPVATRLDGGFVPDADRDVPVGVQMDAPGTVIDGGSGITPNGGTSLCQGMTAAECHLAIINAPVDTTVTAQTVPGATPPAYQTCISQ